MTLDGDIPLDHDCRCETANAPSTPEPTHNPPGQGAIRFRAGTYASFFETMRADAAEQPALSTWTSRFGDDHGIVLLDLFAHLAHVITFYAERAANEAYLRTAIHPESVRALAALIAYRPAEGVAAEVDLAFTADAGKTISLAAGHKVESVPGPGEKPQKLELAGPLTVSHLLNAVPVSPKDVSAPSTWAAAGASSLPLSPFEPIPAALRKGARVAIIDEGAASFEEKEIDAVVRTRTETRLVFKTPLAAEVGSSAKLVPIRDRFLLHGATLPARYLTHQTVQLSVPGTSGTVDSVSTTPVSRTFARTVSDALYLDGLVSGIASGDPLVVMTTETGKRAVVLTGAGASSPVAYTFDDAATTTVTRVSLTRAIPGSPSWDVRDVSVLQGGGAPIAAPGRLLGASVSGSQVLVPNAPGLAALLTPGKAVILDDASRDPIRTDIESATTTGAPPGTLLLSLKKPLSRPLDPATAVLFGNVARAVHGETVRDEVIGSGDATASFQAFPLAKKPLTFVRSAGAADGAASSLSVRVNGVRYDEVASLATAGPDDAVFSTEIDETGKVLVRFGDGHLGARPATGNKNITATYRQGVGAAGNVGAGKIGTLITKPAGLKAVTNPLAATGGVDPEPPEAVRTAAPARLRTLGRVVSRRDFEDAALQVRGVARARASLSRDAYGDDDGVRLVIAPEGGGALGPDLKAAVMAYLDARRDPHEGLRIDGHSPVPLAVSVTALVDTDRIPLDQAREALAAALFGWLELEQRDLGVPIAIAEVERRALASRGVLAVRIDAFRSKDQSPQRDALADPLGLFRVGPEEIAFLADPADLTLDLRDARQGGTL